MSVRPMLEGLLASERRHADELVQRIADVTDALGENRNPGRSLAEDVRALVAECARLAKRAPQLANLTPLTVVAWPGGES